MEVGLASSAFLPHQRRNPPPVLIPKQVAARIGALRAYLIGVAWAGVAMPRVDSPKPFLAAVTASKLNPKQGAVELARPPCSAPDKVVCASAQRRNTRLLAVGGVAVA